jgi:hypothetical protein
VWAVVGAIFVFSGVALLWLQTTDPAVVERAYGTARAVVLEAQAAVSADIVEVRLGEEGGIELLDACDGSFAEMTSYRDGGAIPVFAAHNNCGGDIIHSWTVGDQVRVEGRDTIYQVVETRDTPKRWATTEELDGLRGDFALQTCYYGEDLMKFVGLEPVGTSAKS